MGHVNIKSMAPYQHQQTDEFVIAINKRNADRSALSGVGHTFGHTTVLQLEIRTDIEDWRTGRFDS